MAKLHLSGPSCKLCAAKCEKSYEMVKCNLLAEYCLYFSWWLSVASMGWVQPIADAWFPSPCLPDADSAVLISCPCSSPRLQYSRTQVQCCCPRVLILVCRRLKTTSGRSIGLDGTGHSWSWKTSLHKSKIESKLTKDHCPESLATLQWR